MPRRVSKAADEQKPEHIDVRERFEKLVPAFLALARRSLGGRGIHIHDAEDIAQSALANATAAMSSFRGESEAQFMRWFSTILHNRMVSFVRSDKRCRRVEGASLDAADYVSSPNDLEGMTEELSTMLRTAIDRLPARQRIAMRCYVYELKDLAAIARKLGISVDAARMVKTRALDRLRDILAKPERTTWGSVGVNRSAPGPTNEPCP